MPLRRVRAGRYRASARLRFLGSRARTVVLACYRERTPDPWGRPLAVDKVCGARRLLLAQPARASATAARADTGGAAAPRDATARFVQRGG